MVRWILQWSTPIAIFTILQLCIWQPIWQPESVHFAWSRSRWNILLRAGIVFRSRRHPKFARAPHPCLSEHRIPDGGAPAAAGCRPGPVLGGGRPPATRRDPSSTPQDRKEADRRVRWLQRCQLSGGSVSVQLSAMRRRTFWDTSVRSAARWTVSSPWGTLNFRF